MQISTTAAGAVPPALPALKTVAPPLTAADRTVVPAAVGTLPALPASSPVSAKALQDAVDRLQSRAQAVAPDLQFSVDRETGRTVIRVTDGNTKELIRQIPSEEVLRLDQELDRMRGLLFHQQV